MASMARHKGWSVRPAHNNSTSCRTLPTIRMRRAWSSPSSTTKQSVTEGRPHSNGLPATVPVILSKGEWMPHTAIQISNTYNADNMRVTVRANLEMAGAT